MRQAPRSPLSFKLQRVANVPEHPPPSTRLMSCAHIANRQLSRIIGARGRTLDAPILCQRTHRARRGSPFPLKVDATARDNQSTQDNEKHNRRDYRPSIIFGAPWVRPPAIVARSTSAFKVSTYHR